MFRYGIGGRLGRTIDVRRGGQSYRNASTIDVDVDIVAGPDGEDAIDRAEAEIGEDVIGEAHDRYAAERDAAIPADHTGPRPSGGVGGAGAGRGLLVAADILEVAEDRIRGFVREPFGEIARRTGASPSVAR